MRIQITNSKEAPKLSKEFDTILKEYNLIRKNVTKKIFFEFYNKSNKETSKRESEINVELAFIEVDSLDFLPDLEKKLKEQFSDFGGLLFRITDNGNYRIEICDTYRE